MNNKRTIERIALIGLAGFLVAYFCYQVAYGLTIGPSGSITVTNTTNGLNATFTAPPGTTVSNITIKPIIYTHLNGTWNFVNETKYGTDISGIITFTNEPYKNPYGASAYHFSGTLKGAYDTDAHSFLDLCPSEHHHVKCMSWYFTTQNPNHMELTDTHGDTLHLMRSD